MELLNVRKKLMLMKLKYIFFYATVEKFTRYVNNLKYELAS